jgi:hypothetical protein
MAMATRLNRTAGLFQNFGFLGDVLVLDPVVPDAAAYAAWQQPSSLFSTVKAFMRPAGPVNPDRCPWDYNGPPPSVRAMLDGALAGHVFEEVPMNLLPYKLGRWHAQSRTGNWKASKHPHEYITFSLEFGPGQPEALAERVADGSMPRFPATSKTSKLMKQGPSATPNLASYRMSSQMKATPSATPSNVPSLQRDPFALNRVNG